MAQITITIPDSEVPRIRESFIAMLQEGDAIDMDNPTNQEILVVVKAYVNNAIKKRVDDYEEFIHNSQFTPSDIGMT